MSVVNKKIFIIGYFLILPGVKKLLMLLSCNPGGRFKGDWEMLSLKAGSTFLGGQPVLDVIMMILVMMLLMRMMRILMLLMRIMGLMMVNTMIVIVVMEIKQLN